MMTTDDYLLNLEIDLVLEIFADTGQEVIECGVQLAWGFPPRSKLTLRKVFSPSSCSTTPFQAKSFDVKINVAICREQGVADHQMHVYEWLQQ